MRVLKNTAINVIEKSRNYLYHKGHKEIATRSLKNIESKKGITNPKHIQLSKEYSHDVFGDSKYAPWLYVYCAWAGEFKEGWIPDNYYGEFVVPNLKGEYGKICNRNLLTNSLLEISLPLDICYYINNLFWDTNHKVLNEEKILELLFLNTDKVVYKIEDSRRGKGIYLFNNENFKLDVIKKLGNGVFQNYIEQHPFFSEFTESSVSTIRITSVSDNRGDILVKAANLKIGRRNETHVMADSAIYIAADINSGKLYEYGILPNWVPINNYPDNNLLFKDRVIPAFTDCLAEIIRMHKHIPFVRCIGWDIILDKNNHVRLIEANGGHNGIAVAESMQGPCFKGLSWEKLKKNS